MELSPINRQLGQALSSDQVELVIEWLAEVIAEDATLPPLDDQGRLDQGMLSFKEGQRSVLRKIRVMREELERMGANAPGTS